MKINVTKTVLFILIGLLLSLMYIGFRHYNEKINDLNIDVRNKDNLAKALVDSIDHYVDVNGNLVSEKRTLQADIDDLSDKNLKLNRSQKKLIDHVNELKKEYDVLNSAYIETKTELNDLKNKFGRYDTINKRVVFEDSTKFVDYRLFVSNVMPIKNKKPMLEFDKFDIYNKFNVDFVWGDKDDNYPISVQVRNDNIFTKTTNVESFAIPNVRPDVVKPTKWQKFKKWMKNKSDLLMGVGIGFGAGALLVN
ncbi:MAG: hypothetical protein ACOC2W_03135 [bacterium]